MPVSKSKWMKLPKAKRGDFSYQQYVKWANKRTAQRKANAAKARAAANVTDPFFGNIDFSAIAATPQSVLLGQAKQTATAATAPIIAEIQNAMARQRRAGIADINAATAQAVKAVLPISGQINQDYNTALQQQTAADQYLSGFVKSQGAQAQSQIAGELGEAGLPTNLGPSAAALGAGAGAAIAGYGNTEESRLIGERARQMAYTQRLPAWYKAMGAQNIGKFSRQMADELANNIGQVSQQAPGLVQSTYQSLLEREYNKSLARLGFQMDIGKANLGAIADQNTQQAKNMAAAGKIDPRVSNGANDGWAHNSAGDVVYNSQGNPIPWTVPKTGGAGSSPYTKPKNPQQRLDEANKGAFKLASDLHKAMMKKMGTRIPVSGKDALKFPKGRLPGGPARANIKAHARENAVTQVYAAYKQAFPNAPEAKLEEWTAGALRQGGWFGAAANVGAILAGGTTVGGGMPTKTAPEGPNPFRRISGGSTKYADRLRNSPEREEVKYGMMVNYIVRSLYYNKLLKYVSKQEIWDLAATSLYQVGVWGSKKGVDPETVSRNYTPWKPGKGKGGVPAGPRGGSPLGPGAPPPKPPPKKKPKKPKKPKPKPGAEGKLKPGRPPKKNPPSRLHPGG